MVKTLKMYFFCNILFEKVKMIEHLSNHLGNYSSNFGLKIKQREF